jgi:gamma-glutamyltranspeptidase / glutathione hydrolase
MFGGYHTNTTDTIAGIMLRLFVLTLCALTCMAQERTQARSVVYSTGGIAATSQILASQAGALILQRGGSAVDAAIAANAVLGVVEPMMCGIGGDLFFLHRDGKNGRVSGMNASGAAPAGLSIDYLKQKNHARIPAGIHTVTVPGVVRGWEQAHKRYGRLPWAELFQPAIELAERGFPVSEIIQWDWAHSLPKLNADANAARVYLPAGKAPEAGELFRNSQLARAYRLIAEQGATAFYKGSIATSLLKTSARLGGTLAASDLAAYEPEWVTPIASTYRGWKVTELPPNGQGIGVLNMLNMMERFPLQGADPSAPSTLHAKIEAQKLSVQDLLRHVSDPRVTKPPTEGLLSKKYAEDRAKLIDSTKANCDAVAGEPKSYSGNTIYLAVVDREGSMVSWIQSISDLWGSGIVVDDFGFHLHDRGNGFQFDPSHPNALAPGKRPFHTIIPGLLEQGDTSIGFGIMRGMNQAQAHAQFVSNVVDHGMNIQAALEAPRFTRRTTGGCSVMIEDRVPEATRTKLSEMGHQLDVRGAYSGLMGGGQAVQFNKRSGVKAAASSPRKDGAAVPEAIWSVRQ